MILRHLATGTQQISVSAMAHSSSATATDQYLSNGTRASTVVGPCFDIEFYTASQVWVIFKNAVDSTLSYLWFDFYVFGWSCIFVVPFPCYLHCAVRELCLHIVMRFVTRNENTYYLFIYLFGTWLFYWLVWVGIDCELCLLSGWFFAIFLFYILFLNDHKHT